MLKKILIPVALVGALAACQPPGGGGSKELTERIEKLEKKVEALGELLGATATGGLASGEGTDEGDGDQDLLEHVGLFLCANVDVTSRLVSDVSVNGERANG